MDTTGIAEEENYNCAVVPFVPRIDDRCFVPAAEGRLGAMLKSLSTTKKQLAARLSGSSSSGSSSAGDEGVVQRCAPSPSLLRKCAGCRVCMVHGVSEAMWCSLAGAWPATGTPFHGRRSIM